MVLSTSFPSHARKNGLCIISKTQKPIDRHLFFMRPLVWVGFVRMIAQMALEKSVDVIFVLGLVDCVSVNSCVRSFS